MTETFVIAVNEQREAALVGCAGQRYTSPPQTLEQARALAGCCSAGRWQAPARGGRRSRAGSGPSR